MESVVLKTATVKKDSASYLEMLNELKSEEIGLPSKPKLLYK